ncbi:hypothetical protein [Nocardioides sp. SYSU D00065]|uniref:hypothetical protein n=1 Tax=Nocardioides sp. SYSU D00065 TaxID=2817378 RepID=UPI001B337BFA|nr:hypothetical protein [Nocardioides sp. SYSU D00065]
MTDDTTRDPRPDDQTQPVRAQGTPSDVPAAPADPAPAVDHAPSAAGGPARRGLRARLRTLRSSGGSRTFGLAALIASTLAGVIVGGIGAATVGALTHDRPDWGEHRGRMGRDAGDDGRGPAFGDRGPGQMQPTTPPEDDESDGSTS